MSAKEKKKEEPAYFSQRALDWLAKNGADYSAVFKSANTHEQKAHEYEKVLRRKSLKVCGKELDGYLNEFRAAENELRRLAAVLSNPLFKEKFCKENNYPSEKYDAIIANVRMKASYYQKVTWAYEEAYAKKYGARDEYQTHLLVRDVARSLRQELENAAKKPAETPYRKPPERPAFAQKARPGPAEKETHALVSSYMQELQKKYDSTSEEDMPKYRRGYDRAGGQKYINIAARERRREDEELARYHRGERRIRPEEPVMIARRSVPVKREEELSTGEATAMNLPSVKAPSSVAEAQAQIERLKTRRNDLKKRVASLSGDEKRKASEQLAVLNKDIYRMRRHRDSLM